MAGLAVGDAPIRTAEVARHLPEPLQQWIRRVTEDAVGWFGNVDEAPDLVPAVRRLDAELGELR